MEDASLSLSAESHDGFEQLDQILETSEGRTAHDASPCQARGIKRGLAASLIAEAEHLQAQPRQARRSTSRAPLGRAPCSTLSSCQW